MNHLLLLKDNHELNEILVNHSLKKFIHIQARRNETKHSQKGTLISSTFQIEMIWQKFRENDGWRQHIISPNSIVFKKSLLLYGEKAVDRSLNQSEFFRPLQLHVAFLTGGLDKKQVKNFFAANCRQFKCGNVLTDYASENDKWQMFGKTRL